jgi:hypothetical protein
MSTATWGASVVGAKAANASRLIAVAPKTMEIRVAPSTISPTRLAEDCIENKHTITIMTRPIQDNDVEISEQLWNWARFGLLALVVIIAGLAIAIALGVADPKPVGSLQWEENWQTGSEDWLAFGNKDVTMGLGRLEIAVNAGETGGSFTSNEANEFSFEAAGWQQAGEAGANYGIVFGYNSEDDYTSVTINNNSYVEVVSANGKTWMPLQQWPNILLGSEANRIRVDVQGGQGLIRINDEVLMSVPVNGGDIGVIVRGTAERQIVRFGWTKYWTK